MKTHTLDQSKSVRLGVFKIGPLPENLLKRLLTNPPPSTTEMKSWLHDIVKGIGYIDVPDVDDESVHRTVVGRLWRVLESHGIYDNHNGDELTMTQKLAQGQSLYQVVPIGPRSRQTLREQCLAGKDYSDASIWEPITIEATSKFVVTRLTMPNDPVILKALTNPDSDLKSREIANQAMLDHTAVCGYIEVVNSGDLDLNMARAWEVMISLGLNSVETDDVHDKAAAMRIVFQPGNELHGIQPWDAATEEDKQKALAGIKYERALVTNFPPRSGAMVC